MKSAPTPWYHVNDFEIWDRQEYKPGDFAQSIAAVTPAHVGNSEAFENARLIVTAVNAHAALVRALRLCMEYVPADGDKERDATEAAEDALRLAGELDPDTEHGTQRR